MSSRRDRDRDIKIIRNRDRSPERNEYVNNERKMCYYGSTCYRTNPEHLKEFFHTHLFLDEIVNKLKLLDDKFEIGEKIINPEFKNINDPEFKNINDNNDKKLKEFIIYCIQNFKKIVEKYNIKDLRFIFIQFDARNASRTLEVCDNRLINIEKKMNGNSYYNDINIPERKKNKDCIHINSSCVLVLLQDYLEKQEQQQQNQQKQGGKKTYKRKTYNRKTYNRKTYKRKTYNRKKTYKRKHYTK